MPEAPSGGAGGFRHWLKRTVPMLTRATKRRGRGSA
jgi:hypothetical protein